MKQLFVLLMIVLPLIGHASDTGWGERGNGNEDTPPACKHVGDKINPIMPRPIPEPRVKGSETDLSCVGDSNPIDDIGRIH